MSIGVILRKSLTESLRDRVGLSLSTLTAPVFVLLYGLIFLPLDDRAPTLSISLDAPKIEHAFSPSFDVVSPADVDSELRKGALDFAVDRRDGALRIRGDATSSIFLTHLPELQARLYRYEYARYDSPRTEIVIAPIASSGDRSRFDLYVPSLLVFALIMLVFSSSMGIAREAERGTLNRLRMTLLKPSHYLLGASIAHLGLGAVSVILTFAVALGFGFRPEGSLALGLLIAALTGASCVSMGTVVASLSANTLQAFLLGSAFMFLLVLFSGLVFPVPEVAVLELLPTVHAVDALGAVLHLGADFGEVWESLAKLAGLALAYFTIGWALFSRLYRNRVGERA